MRSHASPKRYAFLAAFFLFLFTGFQSFAQTPGLIVRPTPPASAPAVLDPNQDGFASTTNTGFNGHDVGATYSEVPYKIVPPFKLEPTSDLMRGPNERFTDLVRISNDESGMYVFNDGTNMLFRLRLGDIVPGSKGYSILIDADGKFGATGPNADPNYQPATTGINGNPGFEIEVVLETNFRVAIYDVDGKTDAGNTPRFTYTLNTNSQISLAYSNVSGTPDYLYDFYVPLADLKYGATGQVTATTPIRVSSTTVMSPQAAIGGPKSDIYGYDGTDYMKAWETIINAQPAFTPNNVTAAGSGISSTLCTAAPTLNSPINTGTVTISGTWIQADISRPSSASITLYKNGTAVGTASVSTGGTWSISGVTAASGDVFYAKAQASGESACLQSNSITVVGCTILPATPTINCASTKGLTGTIPLGTTVQIYQVVPGTLSPTSGTLLNSGLVYTDGATSRAFNLYGTNPQSGNACQGQQSFLSLGTYMLVTSNGSCSSAPLFICVTGSNQNAWSTLTTAATPSITAPVYSYQTSVTVTGTTSGNVIRLYNNDKYVAAATASGTSVTFTGLTLSVNDQLKIYTQTSTATACVTQSGVTTVACYVQPPVITATNSQLQAGSVIAGSSSEAAGTTIKVYDASAPATPVATVTVQSGGTWSSGFNAVSDKTYYAVASTACGSSSNSASVSAAGTNATIRCGSITMPVAETATSVSGTLSGTAVANTTVRLFLDGVLIGATTTSTNAWSVTSIAANTLYPGGVLSIDVQEPNKLIETCAIDGTKTVSCASPAAPSVTPVNATVSTSNGKTVFTITGSQSGILYTLEDASNGADKSVSVFGTGGTITLTSYAFLTPGVNTLRVSAFKLGAPASCSNSYTAVTLTATDNDGDNIIDPADIDDDNDGILDSNESATYDPTGDADGDGVPNYKDTTPGVTGLPTTDSNSDGILDYFDADRDGVINQFDLDTDNDGIPDLLEAYGTDADNNGLIDGATDTDGDGLRNAVDAATGVAGSNGLAAADFDGDGVPNFRDLDSDGDGALDSRESGLNQDADFSGVLNGSEFTDAVKNGWSDVIDNLSGPLALRNTDGRSRPDYLDIDNDDDGIVDNIELRSTASTLVSSGTDTDGDGIDNTYDNVSTAGTFGGNANNGLTPHNADGDPQPDYRDLDSDNDGFPDAAEGHDTNGDNLPNANAYTKNGVGGTADADSDGLLDGYDNNTAATNPANNTIPSNYPNTDNAATVERDWREADDADKDGIIDTNDIDDDNDGIPDGVEGGGVSAADDADNDGLLNYLDPVPGTGVPAFVDANGDGISDAFDADKDGIINALDLDSDNDGIPDIVEAGGIDANGDGRVDFTGTFAANDSDGDGLINVYDVPANALGSLDTDGDGVKNFLDLDSDNDGIPDVVEAGGVDANNDGRIDSYSDADGDGLDSRVDGDANNDGAAENTAGAWVTTRADTNNDGKADGFTKGDFDGDALANPYDLDSDGDGITDLREAGFQAYDTNTDGLINSSDAVSTDANTDGWFDVIDNLAALNLPNNDASAQPDYLDIDSDDDGITDNVEGQATDSYAAPAYTDSDADGIDNRYDNKAGFGGRGITPVDTDSDTLPDYYDTDADGDGDPDRIEGNDLNLNKRADDITAGFTTTDTDGDGLVDFFESNVSNGPVVTIIGFGGTGGKSTAQKTISSFANRDWRNRDFSLTAYVLPVKFVSVAASPQPQGVQVSWVVTAEENVKNYEVEKSTDGVQFTKVGEVPFRPAGAAENQYSFLDRSASAPVRYYRIRQVDVDGKYLYSAVVAARVQEGGSSLVLYPNPVRGQSYILLQAERTQKATLQVADVQGKLLAVRTVPLQKGRNILSADELNPLPAGSYVLLVTVEGKVQQVKFVKQ